MSFCVCETLPNEQRKRLAGRKEKDRRRSKMGIHNVHGATSGGCLRSSTVLTTAKGMLYRAHQTTRATTMSWAIFTTPPMRTGHVVLPKVEREVLPQDGHQKSVLPPIESLGNPLREKLFSTRMHRLNCSISGLQRKGTGILIARAMK